VLEGMIPHIMGSISYYCDLEDLLVDCVSIDTSLVSFSH
jgi:hypothetical protein